MRTFVAILVQVGVLIVVSFVVGLSINAMRERDHINPMKDYTPEVRIKPPHEPGQKTAQPTTNGGGESGGDEVTSGHGENGSDEDGTAPTPPGTEEGPGAAEGDDEGGPDSVELDPDPNEYPVQVVGVKGAIEIFNEDATEYGLNVFVDARADGPYKKGHIPGAVQCDYYRIEQYMDSVLDRVMGASKVIVYCHGGECEDSLYVCSELLQMEVPWDRIYLFVGGWEAWEEAGMPYETGRKE